MKRIPFLFNTIALPVIKKSTAFKQLLYALLFAIISFSTIYAQDTSTIINDITRLNPIQVSKVIIPTSTIQIIDAVRTHSGPIAIGGGRYSMGGQTATDQALHIDMRQFDSIISFSQERKEITVQTGITWRKIQEFIDPYNLSVSIMQSYANFTVGGSLSVNVHGRYIGKGPLILSVKQIRIILADGTLVTATPEVNRDVFYGAIGGYGGLGVITEATLQLTDNVKVKRTDKVLKMADYRQYFFDHIRNDSSVVFHNGNIYPKRYRKVREVSFRKTQEDITVKHRLKPLSKHYRFNRFGFKLISGFPGGKWIRQYVFDPLIYAGNPVVWQNYEAGNDVLELEPRSRRRSTYVLQEYFVPVERFDEFYPLMAAILRRYNANVVNISIRHAKQDPGSLMAWARTEVFAFVIYYRQGTTQKDKDEVKQWTQELIDAAITCKGTYYLPYQIYATPEQFVLAYPSSSQFFQLKKQLDPTNKFRNKLWDAYYR